MSQIPARQPGIKVVAAVVIASPRVGWTLSCRGPRRTRHCGQPRKRGQGNPRIRDTDPPQKAVSGVMSQVEALSGPHSRRHPVGAGHRRAIRGEPWGRLKRDAPTYDTTTIEEGEMALSHRAVDEAETGSIGWYASTSEDALARLSSDRQGLSGYEAARRLAEHGPNRLTRQQGPSAWAVLGRQFASPLIYALLIAAVVAFALGDLADGAVVLGVVVLNALIGFVQEYRAGRAIEALAQLVSEPTTVLRDQRWTPVDAADLVPRDVVSVE